MMLGVGDYESAVRELPLPNSEQDKLIELIGQWYVEAGKYNVMPVDGRGTARFAEKRPQIAKDRSSYTFYPGTRVEHWSRSKAARRS